MVNWTKHVIWDWATTRIDKSKIIELWRNPAVKNYWTIVFQKGNKWFSMGIFDFVRILPGWNQIPIYIWNIIDYIFRTGIPIPIIRSQSNKSSHSTVAWLKDSGSLP